MTREVAIVTGGASGIGRAVAEKLARTMTVVSLDMKYSYLTNPETLNEWIFDISNLHQIPDVVSKIEAQYGPIIHLVNAAGVVDTQPITEITPESMRRTFAVNVDGPFFLMREIAERMAIRQKGSIVAIASVSGFLPKLEQVDYGASKAALISLTRSMAMVFGPNGVRINAVAPGVIDTPMTQSIAKARAEIRGVTPESTLDPVIQSTPLRRIGSAYEVANVVAFLLSDEARYVTGQTYGVDGGFLMR